MKPQPSKFPLQAFCILILIIIAGDGFIMDLIARTNSLLASGRWESDPNSQSTCTVNGKPCSESKKDADNSIQVCGIDRAGKERCGPDFIAETKNDGWKPVGEGGGGFTINDCHDEKGNKTECGEVLKKLIESRFHAETTDKPCAGCEEFNTDLGTECPPHWEENVDCTGEQCIHKCYYFPKPDVNFGDFWPKGSDGKALAGEVDGCISVEQVERVLKKAQLAEGHSAAECNEFGVCCKVLLGRIERDDPNLCSKISTDCTGSACDQDCTMEK
jgi:hypothetical protein